MGRDANGTSMYQYNKHISEEEWGQLAAGNAVLAQETPPPADDPQQAGEAASEEAASGQVVEETGRRVTRAGDSAVSRGVMASAPGHIFHAVKW